MLTKDYLMILALTLLAGCRGPLPCPECMDDDIAEDSPDDAEDAEPLPDLPCGGADLLTDNDNCGTCGNECSAWYEGTEWESGICVDGTCGPHWTLCGNYSGQNGGLPRANCAEVCAGYGDGPCVAQGCSGMTAMLFYVGFNGACEAWYGPDIAMTGSCEEPIPWEMTIEYNIYAMCCCEP